jgi:excisionase family DNA binding protein
MSNHVTVAVVPDSAVEVGGEHEVGDQPPVRKAKSDPEPDSDESPKPKRKERLARKAYSVDETAEITNLSPATIWRLISAKKLATVKVGGRRLVPNPAIDALLAAD